MKTSVSKELRHRSFKTTTAVFAEQAGRIHVSSDVEKLGFARQNLPSTA